MTPALLTIGVVAACTGAFLILQQVFFGNGRIPLPPADDVSGVAAGSIVYSDRMDASWDLYSINAHGSDVVRLTHSAGDELVPRWSPDGRRLAFVYTGSPDEPAGIYVMNDDASGRQVAYRSEGRIDDLDWSPDGASLAFVLKSSIEPPGESSEPPAGETSTVSLLNMQTGRVTELVDSAWSVDWSPDGRWILFTRVEPTDGRYNSNDLWLVRPDGTGERQLTTDGLSMNGSWSPDGAQIVFESYDPASGPELDVFLMGADSGGRTRLSFDPGNDYLPSWSPDGSHVLYVSRRASGDGNASSCYLMVVGADGSNERALLTDRGELCSGDPTWGSTARETDASPQSEASQVAPGGAPSVLAIFDSSRPLLTPGYQATLEGAEARLGYRLFRPSELTPSEVWVSPELGEAGLRYDSDLVITYALWPPGTDVAARVQEQARSWGSGSLTEIGTNPAWVIPQDDRGPGQPPYNVVLVSVGRVEVTLHGRVPMHTLLDWAESLQ